MIERNSLDEHWMERCLTLAKTGQGKTSPNPLVGSVIVKEGQKIGEGFHPYAGAPHAEVFALRQAGAKAHGATLYVNLEPCSHYGRTPPCVLGILEAGIQKVVVGQEDPNPRVCGAGIAKLKSAGVEVVCGVLEDECRKLNETFLHYMMTGKPFVTWKVASTLDGKVATSKHDSFWVTGEKTREHTRKQRSYFDAILVGANTVLRDNPKLTARPLVEGCSQPIRILLDTQGRIPQDACLFYEEGSSLWVVGKHARVPVGNAEVLVSPSDRIDIEWLLLELGRRSITSLLLEGGPTVATSFLQAKAIQKVQWYLAPKLLGQDGLHAVGNLLLEKMDDALILRDTSLEQIEDDYCMTGYFCFS